MAAGSNLAKKANARPRGGSSLVRQPRPAKKNFLGDLNHIMYGFGDIPEPRPESKALLDQMLTNYVTEFVQAAVDATKESSGQSLYGSSHKLDEKSLTFRITNPHKKQRVDELLKMNEELKDAQRVELFEKIKKRPTP